MYRIMGNSHERVPLSDLNDVIYYKQIKDFSDQEYENSKDLRREIRKGRITVLDKSDSLRATVGESQPQIHQSSQLNINDLKQALREVLPELQYRPSTVKDILKDAIPSLIDTVRRELSSVVKGQEGFSSEPSSEYIPTISTQGMVSNVKADERKVSGSNLNSSLEALKKLKRNS